MIDVRRPILDIFPFEFEFFVKHEDAVFIIPKIKLQETSLSAFGNYAA